ncbi:MAG: ATP-dependent DNA ligase, partial [Nocardioidaceae bacterium]|nr:ATP-dependent DNA ligase [Nocardioidaceae bacterium]
MLLYHVVATSGEVAGTQSRLAKRKAIAGLLQGAAADDIAIVVAYLAGELRQRKAGIGWAALKSLPPPAAAPSLTLQEVDAEFD